MCPTAAATTSHLFSIAADGRLSLLGNTPTRRQAAALLHAGSHRRFPVRCQPGERRHHGVPRQQGDGPDHANRTARQRRQSVRDHADRGVKRSKPAAGRLRTQNWDHGRSQALCACSDRKTALFPRCARSPCLAHRPKSRRYCRPARRLTTYRTAKSPHEPVRQSRRERNVNPSAIGRRVLLRGATLAVAAPVGAAPCARRDPDPDRHAAAR